MNNHNLYYAIWQMRGREARWFIRDCYTRYTFIKQQNIDGVLSMTATHAVIFSATINHDTVDVVRGCHSRKYKRSLIRGSQTGYGLCSYRQISSSVTDKDVTIKYVWHTNGKKKYILLLHDNSITVAYWWRDNGELAIEMHHPNTQNEIHVTM